MDTPKYWLIIGENPVGPLTMDQIQIELKAGRITDKAKACRVGDGQWKELRELPEFTTHETPPLPTIENDITKTPLHNEEEEKTAPWLLRHIWGFVGAAVIVCSIRYGLPWIFKQFDSTKSEPTRSYSTGRSIMSISRMDWTPPRSHGQVLVGTWQSTVRGSMAVYSFDANGTFLFHTLEIFNNSSQPVATQPVAGRWSLQNNTLRVDFPEGLLMGESYQTEVRFVDDNAIQLLGLPSEETQRTFQRKR